MKRFFIICFLFLFIFNFAGCIRTRVIIDTTPPNAKVTFNDVYRGKSPIEIPFTYYWYYKVKVEKEGYKPIEKIERFYAPPWFYMPFDLFMEAIPFPIHDTHQRFYVLEKEE